MMRYKQMHAGLEGVAWYCDRCDAEVYQRGMGYRDGIVATEIRRGLLAFCHRRFVPDVPPLRISTPRT